MSEAITAKTPWVKNLGDVPAHLDYFQGSMYEAVERIARQNPNAVAFDFMGRSTTYKKMIEEIQRCAKSLRTIGVREGDCVTIAMPKTALRPSTSFTPPISSAPSPTWCIPCPVRRRSSFTSTSPRASLW